jgi:outer membrane protein OmpA-like peptidoglycan-associated protein
MKRLVYLALAMSFFVHLVLPAKAQIGNDPRAYYVVIGAFAIKKNAINFTRTAAKTYDAKYDWNPLRNLDYVYILKVDDKQVAIDEAMRLRSTTKYDDTWVYHGVLGKDADISFLSTDINPATAQHLSDVPPNDLEQESSVVPVSTLRSDEVQISSIQPDNAKEAEPEEVLDPRAKAFRFTINRADTKVSIEGEIAVIDTEKARKIGTYDANKRVGVLPPANPNGDVSLICEVFGYRKVQREINYNAPVGDGIKREGETVVVPFELMRLQKGDIATMFHVYYFKDAAVMRPESRYEVNSLVEMMNENEKYKIRIHGHTNGNAAGKITSLDSGADNYFALNNTSDGFGSAKKLSQLRAELLRDYLVDNGIDIKRLQVKAWGGKKPIVDKFHTQAQSNVRVEIEILDN